MRRRRRNTELTRRGWSLFGAACGLILASRLFGIVELMALGLVSLFLLQVSWLWVRIRLLDCSLERTLGPSRIHVGGEGRIDLRVTNRSPMPNPIMAVSERFGDGRRAARFLIPSLARGASARAAYRIPTARRGKFALGPFAASVTDPFGLARRRLIIGVTDQVTIYPRLHDLASPPPGSGQRRASADAVTARALTLDGDEFTTLREYEMGDDLRKVHWPATARTGELFIRQNVAFREPQVVILLDTRDAASDDAGFELAVEVVASLLARLSRDGRRLAIRTTAGTALGHADDVAVGLDHLSVIETIDEPRPLSLAPLEQSAALCVLVTGRLAPSDHAVLAADRRRPIIVVTTQPSDRPPAGITWVDVAGGDPVAPWNLAVGRARSAPRFSRRGSPASTPTVVAR